MKPKKKKKGNYLAKNISEELSRQLTFGQKMADLVAAFVGGWTFILSFLFFLFLWMFYQSVVVGNRGFDPYPYILLNLVLSCLAAIQAPLILMSQNREAQMDCLRAEHDYEINLKAEQEIEHIQEELDYIRGTQDTKFLEKLEEIRRALGSLEKAFQELKEFKK